MEPIITRDGNRRPIQIYRGLNRHGIIPIQQIIILQQLKFYFYYKWEII
jgi:hypothetical protein